MLIIKSYDELGRAPRAGDRIKNKDVLGKTSWSVGVVVNETKNFLEDPAIWLHESMLDALLT